MYPYRRHHFPTWHDLGVLEEAMKDVNRSPLPLDLNYDPDYHHKKRPPGGEGHQESQSALPSVMNLLGSCIKHYVEGDEGKPGKFMMNVPIGKNIGPNDVHVSCKGGSKLDATTTTTDKNKDKDKDKENENEEEDMDRHDDDHNLVIVKVKKEHRSLDGSSRLYREVTRTFNLDQNVDLTQLKSILTPEGFLTFEAPLHHPRRAESENSNNGDFDFVEGPDYVD